MNAKNSQKIRCNIKSSFEEDGGFPGIIGVVDGTHIHIRAPKHEPDTYINKKKFHSINVRVFRKTQLNRQHNTT